MHVIAKFDRRLITKWWTDQPEFTVNHSSRGKTKGRNLKIFWLKCQFITWEDDFLCWVCMKQQSFRLNRCIPEAR